MQFERKKYVLKANLSRLVLLFRPESPRVKVLCCDILDIEQQFWRTIPTTAT